MCGIAGYVSKNVINNNALISNQLQGCLDEIKHRGPDDFGLVSKDNAILGHRRLSIIDLSSKAKQPLLSKCGRYTLVFNGEIYNYLELKQQLESKGIAHYTKSDTEVLFNLLILDGEKCLNKLNGMFAFGFYDALKNKLLLARDRFGKKPIFYSADQTDIIFCSELYPLKYFEKLRQREINHNAISSYFSCQFIRGNNTIYEGIKQLAAASYLIYESGKTSIHSYWKLNKINSVDIPFEEAKETFTEILHDAVKIRMRADVPLGTFLSGGLDSTMITRLMMNISENVKSFSIGFEDESYDESPYAIAEAKSLGTEHINTMTTMSGENIKNILRHLGQPMADPSVIPFWDLCKETRKHVTVALSGDGADEILGGYNRYLAANKLEPILSLTPSIFYSLVERLIPEGHDYYAKSMLKKLRLSARLALAITVDARLSPTLFLDKEKALLLPDIPIRPTELDASFFQHQPLASRMMLDDISNYLKNDILVKVDNISMAHSLEIRSPFLDYRLVEFVTSLPQSYKIRGNIQKRLLREVAKNLVSQTVLNRPKHGFAVPVSKWLANTLKADFLGYLEQAPDFISKDYVHTLFLEHCSNRKDNGLKLWSIYLLLMWHKHYRF